MLYKVLIKYLSKPEIDGNNRLSKKMHKNSCLAPLSNQITPLSCCLKGIN